MEPVDLIVCYCQEDLDWLTVLWKLPWTEDDHSEMIKGWVNLRMVHKCPQFVSRYYISTFMDKHYHKYVCFRYMPCLPLRFSSISILDTFKS